MDNTLTNELEFQYTKSSGAGGQHVNKVATKVVLLFNVQKSKVLNEEEKVIILEKLKSVISKKGVLRLTSEATRSQYKNKEIVISRFVKLIQDALKPLKKRKKTKRPKSANLKRLEKKKNLALKKTNRKKIRDY